MCPWLTIGVSISYTKVFGFANVVVVVVVFVRADYTRRPVSFMKDVVLSSSGRGP